MGKHGKPDSVHPSTLSLPLSLPLSLMAISESSTESEGEQVAQLNQPLASQPERHSSEPFIWQLGNFCYEYNTMVEVLIIGW